jgi:hypothetical protein
MQTLGFMLELAPDPVSGFEQCQTRRAVPCHRDARMLLDFWNERGRVLVMGQDLPSRRIARLLPNLAILDYRAARQDFRVRLAGFLLMRRFGRDIGQHYLSEVVPGQELERIHALLMEAYDTGMPVIRDIKIKSPMRPLLHYELVLLRALAVDLQTPLVLMGLFFFDRKKRAAAASA